MKRKRNNDKEFLEKLKIYVNGLDTVVTANELAKKFEIEPKEAVNYLRDLEYNGFITKKGKGAYFSYLNTKLKPMIDVEIERINRIIKNTSPFMEFVIWSLFNLKNFYYDIPGKNYVFIEAREKYELDTIRATLIENEIESVLLTFKGVDFKDFIFKNTVPVILVKRGTMMGTIKINTLLTPTIERMIVDLYYYITKRELPFPIEELGNILQKSIETGFFNFTFMDSYLRLRRGLEFDFLIIFSRLFNKLPYIIPEKYSKKLESIKQNVNSFIGD